MNLSQQKQSSVLEKRKHLIITALCNNNCKFCLAADMQKDGNRMKDGHRPLSWIENEMKNGIIHGFNRLIISGGDPTIHPELVEIIKKAKSIGYKHVQIITNGRMFASIEFLQKCINAGLDEITFSIHGHTAELHDYLTQVNGSFAQTVTAIRNALKSGIIVSSDIVLNKKNYASFPEIVKFLFQIGIREIDVLHLVPFGNAYSFKDEMFYDLNMAIPYIKQGLKFAKDNGIVIWTNRFPAQYLDGFEDLIQDSSKLIDEMYGRKEQFESALAKNEKPSCYGERCKHCNMWQVCEVLFKANDMVKAGKEAGKISSLHDSNSSITSISINLDSSALQKITNLLKSSSNKNTSKEILFILPHPGKNLLEYSEKTVKLSEEIPKIKSLLAKHGYIGKFIDVPQCLCGEDSFIIQDNIANINYNYLKDDGNIDVIKYVEQFSLRNKVKGLKCKQCKFNNKCDGIFQKYIQVYGFGELKPILKI